MLVIFTGWQCLDSPDFPDEPYIEFTQVSKDTMLQGNFQEDSVFVLFHFQDGDGDIGKSSQDAENNVFFIDERTGIVESTFGIPAIPQEGANNGVEGDVRILVFTTCCFYPPETGILPCEPNELIPLDTIQYRFYMKDNAIKLIQIRLNPSISKQLSNFVSYD